MVNYFDDQLKNITDTMKALGMWENTLMIFTADNGAYVRDPKGPCNFTKFSNRMNPKNADIGHGTVCFNGEAGGNNYPLEEENTLCLKVAFEHPHFYLVGSFQIEW